MDNRGYAAAVRGQDRGRRLAMRLTAARAVHEIHLLPAEPAQGHPAKAHSN